MSADSRLLVQAVREGINREHLLLNDVGGQLGWSRDKTKNVFSGRTKLSGDDVLDILSNPNVPIPDFKRYRMFPHISQPNQPTTDTPTRPPPHAETVDGTCVPNAKQPSTREA